MQAQCKSRFFHFKQPFAMHRGGQLQELTLAWESWGELNTVRDNAILILTGLSPNAHAASSHDDPTPGWWEFMIGPGKPIDTDRWYVICVNSLGSCKGSTGPASENPATGKVYGLDFPELSIQDVAESTRILVESHLNIETLHAIVGPSMGGMSALAYQAAKPGSARHLISISSTPAADPFAIAIRSLQREMIRADRAWKGGQYDDENWPETGMRLARKLGMISYRSAIEWRHRFTRQLIPQERMVNEPFAKQFEIESYLDAHADRFVGGFDPNSYIYLSRAMDWFSIADSEKETGVALGRLKFDSALVIAVDTDILFPAYQQEQIRDGLATGGTAVTYHALPSIQGHDAFLVDIERFDPAVRQYMSTL